MARSDGRAKAVGTEIVRRLQDSADVGQVQSAWTVSPSAAKSFVSVDGRTGLIVAAITGGENDAQRNAKQLYDELVYDRDGVTVRAGGDATVYWQVNAQTEKDLLLMEALALPLSFLVLVWVFGGLVAAALPVAVGDLRDSRVHGVAARDLDVRGRVDIRPQPVGRDGHGACHRLHLADPQPVPG